MKDVNIIIYNNFEYYDQLSNVHRFFSLGASKVDQKLNFVNFRGSWSENCEF